ncbi:hypothetical protein ONS95_004439 [Cadophora gregata]|uniref:uncharacterized protein n=1 Tax=Cadophora gregata TaxID=51156 RepID=UPI0026DD0ECE|nr:uncharacterized protein ONS95_004439 [Cadophora gregata]KAK0105163.1 hypothetical protein ONS96_004564 [Cadophora gregata f. sp. sojae]KAK0105926.1 hypothetical protein ONS95_004439 [Cadophora gregata]
MFALDGGPGTNPLSKVLDVMLETVTDNKFWTVKKAHLPPLRDLLAGYVQLLSRGMEVQPDMLKDPTDSGKLGCATARCLISHSLTAGAIAIFI